MWLMPAASIAASVASARRLAHAAERGGAEDHRVDWCPERPKGAMGSMPRPYACSMTHVRLIANVDRPVEDLADGVVVGAAEEVVGALDGLELDGGIGGGEGVAHADALVERRHRVGRAVLEQHRRRIAAGETREPCPLDEFGHAAERSAQPLRWEHARRIVVGERREVGERVPAHDPSHSIDLAAEAHGECQVSTCRLPEQHDLLGVDPERGGCCRAGNAGRRPCPRSPPDRWPRRCTGSRWRRRRSRRPPSARTFPATRRGSRAVCAGGC